MIRNRGTQLFSILVITGIVLFLALNIDLKQTGQIISETQTITTKNTSYVYAHGLAASYDSEGKEKYYINDHLGGTGVVIDKSGNVVASEEYLAFGEEKAAVGDEKFTYTGKELDDTGLYYYGTRYYDTDTGRFTQPDPLIGGIENPQSLNRYAYTLNNPLKYTDPSGMDEEVYGPPLPKADATKVSSPENALPSEKEKKGEDEKIPSYSEFIKEYPLRRDRFHVYQETENGLVPIDSLTSKSYYDIVDMPLFCSLQTCADIPLTLYAEYQKEYKDNVLITLNRGEVIKWSDWESQGKSWEDFLRYAFEYTSSEALLRFSMPVEKVEDLQPGDMITEVFKNSRGYGHTRVVKSVEEIGGEKVYRVFSGSDPVRDPRILNFRASQIQELVNDGASLRRFPSP